MDKEISQLTELAKIIRRSVKGEQAAQRELYLQFRVKWYMLCLRYGKNKHEADDILQEGLIQIYKDLHQFNAKKSSFATWSSRVLSHSALRYLKKNNWHNTVCSIDEVLETEDATETIYSKLATRELTELIQTLPVGYRLVFNMYVLEGYTHKEIAEELETNIGTSKSQLSKAKKMLRSKLEFQLIENTKR